MRPVSAAFIAAVRQSHTPVVQVDVLVAASGVLVPLVAVVDGSVTLDARAATRGRLDLSLVDDGTLGLAPTSPSSLLAPYGNQLIVRKGLVLPTGVTETTAIGTFRIEDCNVDSGDTGTSIALTGMDRSAIAIAARFEDAYQVVATTNIEQAIRDVLAPAFPTLVTSFPGSAFTTPTLTAQPGEDRWAFAQSIATASGLDLYFDGDGVLVLRPRAAGDPVASFAEGEGGVLLHAARGWTRTGGYNRWIVTGQNTGLAAPVRGVATDLDPLSPTYYFGPFGPVPEFAQSEFITTTAQAEAAAAAMAARSLGTTQSVTFGVIVDPSLEPGDVVSIRRAVAGINETNVIDQLTIPLGVSTPMTGVTRARRVS